MLPKAGLGGNRLAQDHGPRKLGTGPGARHASIRRGLIADAGLRRAGMPAAWRGPGGQRSKPRQRGVRPRQPPQTARAAQPGPLLRRSRASAAGDDAGRPAAR